METSQRSGISRGFAIGASVVSVAGLFYLAFAAPHANFFALHFNPYAILSGCSFLLGLGVLLYFVHRPARTEERIWLSIFLAGGTGYSFVEMLQRLSADRAAAIFWITLEAIVVLMIPALYLFVITYTSQTERRYTGTIAVLMVAMVAYVFFLGFTNVLFDNNPAHAQMLPWGWVNAANAGEYLFALWIDTLLVASLVRMIRFRRHTRNPILRKQSLIFIFALTLPLFVGTITDAILPALGVEVLPPLATTFYAVAGAIMIYGVMRYQLLTISPIQFSSTILGIMQDPVVVTSTKFDILYVNPEAEKMLGIHEGSAVKALLTDRITSDSVTKFTSAFAQSEGSGETVTVDIDQIDIMSPHSDRSTPVRVRASRLPLGDNMQTLIIILTDITKELQTRSVIEHEVEVRTAELNQARAYLISSINSLEQGFILLNTKGHIELANGMASARLQSASDKLTGVDITEAAKVLTWDADLAKTAHTVLESQRAKQLKVASADGSYFTVFVTPIIDGKHVLGATVVIEDVTEARILERSKEEFFSIASHELRTPLTAIRGNMSIAQQYFADSLKDESFASLINDTHDASVRLIEIVNDFLDSSKLEQGKMEFNLQPVDVAPIIEAVQKDLQTLLESQKDKLSVEHMSKLPKVMVDESRFRQIMYNIISNAIKYTNEGQITITADHDEKYVRIHIADTGKGISPENQKLLFHKFQQAGSSILTRDNTKGTGLGLYISRMLASNMHGDVALEKTEIGKGTTFMLTLPLANTHKAGKER